MRAIVGDGADLDEAAYRLFGGRRPIVVSHRGPQTYEVADDGRLIATAGAGGLAGALRSLSDRVPLAWASCAMGEGDRRAAASGAELRFGAARLRLAALPDAVYRLHYEVASNPILWFVQHGIADALAPGRADELGEAWRDGYRPANARLAAVVADELGRADVAPVVFVHDYQLYLVPRLLRRRRPSATISHFVHIPWPAPAAWGFLPLPIRREIVEGLLAADVVGFQTRRDAACFLAACRAWLPGARVDGERGAVEYAGHRARVRSYPISVDVRATDALKDDPRFRAHRARLAAEWGRDPDARTIVRVDRLDPSKNVVRGFLAFERLLEDRSEWRGRVTFRSFLVPSRSSIPEYRRLAGEVFGLVDRINLRFGTPDWQPIHLTYEHDREQALAGLSLADAMLVNPIADGMNLVAKEGALVNERDGVLVLSRAAGAYDELGAASLGVDPLDVPGTAAALARALAMPAGERRTRARALRAAVERADLETWIRRQLRDLEALVPPTLSVAAPHRDRAPVFLPGAARDLAAVARGV